MSWISFLFYIVTAKGKEGLYYTYLYIYCDTTETGREGNICTGMHSDSLWLACINYEKSMELGFGVVYGTDGVMISNGIEREWDYSIKQWISMHENWNWD